MKTRRHLLAIGSSVLVASMARIGRTKAAPGDHGHPCDHNGEGVPPFCECLQRGTRILTPRGYVPIENLSIGDGVVTSTDVLPVIDIHNFQTYDNALRVESPLGSVVLTEAHGIQLTENEIVDAGLLKSLPHVHPMPGMLRDWFHVKLAKHSIIYANGIAVESLGGKDVEPGDFVRIGFNGHWSRIASHVRRLLAGFGWDMRKPIDFLMEQIEDGTLK